MSMSPLLLIHICAAVVGLLSGFLTMAFRKGSGLHGAAGNVFFVSMLIMSASAAYLAAFRKPNMMNVVVGLLTFYLVATAWWAAKRRDGGASPFDFGALLFVLAVGVAGVGFGFEAANSPKGTKDGMPAAAYFIFGSVALLCASSDLRMFVRGGVSGSNRIARHLWRMSLALLIATLSFFPGQARQLPEWLRENNFLYVPHLLLIGSMVFWMYRVRFRKRLPRPRVIRNRQGDAFALQSQPAAHRPDGPSGEGKSMSANAWIKRSASVAAVALITSGVTIDNVDFSNQRVDRAEVSVETVRQGAPGIISRHAPDRPRTSTHSAGSGVRALVQRVPRIIAQQVLERILRESYDLRLLPGASKLTTEARANRWREFYLIISQF